VVVSPQCGFRVEETRMVVESVASWMYFILKRVGKALSETVVGVVVVDFGRACSG
jgi:hypothetical protein